MFTHLRTRDLSKCRLVCKLWNYCATNFNKWTLNLNESNINQYLQSIGKSESSSLSESFKLSLTVNNNSNETIQTAIEILQESEAACFTSIKVETAEESLDVKELWNLINLSAPALKDLEFKCNFIHKQVDCLNSLALNLSLDLSKLNSLKLDAMGPAAVQIGASLLKAALAVQTLSILCEVGAVVTLTETASTFSNITSLEIRLEDEITISKLCDIQFSQLIQLKLYQTRSLRLLGQFLSYNCPKLEALSLHIENPLSTDHPQLSSAPPPSVPAAAAEYFVPEDFLSNIPELNNIKDFGIYGGNSDTIAATFETENYSRLGETLRLNLRNACTQFPCIRNLSTNLCCLHALTFLSEYYNGYREKQGICKGNLIVFPSVITLCLDIPIARISDASLGILNYLLPFLFPNLEEIIIQIQLPADFYQWNAIRAGIAYKMHKEITTCLLELNCVTLRSLEVRNYYGDWLSEVVAGGNARLLQNLRGKLIGK